MTLSELLQELGELKTVANNHYKAYKDLKLKEDELKAQLIAKLDEAGLKSAKGDKYSVSKVTKHDVVVTHEQSVLDWLKETPDVEEDAYIGLRTTQFKTLARQMLKDTGELAPGTETTISEVLTVKENKR